VPALAYDADAYAYGAGHMVRTSDVPANLGSFGRAMLFSANEGRLPIEVCDIDGVTYRAPGGKVTFTGNFSTRADGGNSLSEQVTWFASASAAIGSFRTLSARAQKCTGTQSGTWTDDDGVEYSWSALTTHGKVPMDTVTGVESIFVNVNYVDASSTQANPTLRDAYQVFTLVDDAIIVTSFTREDEANVATGQRKSVNEVAFRAIGRWVD
jgi:hypothetical protein